MMKKKRWPILKLDLIAKKNVIEKLLEQCNQKKK